MISEWLPWLVIVAGSNPAGGALYLEKGMQ